MFSILIPVFNRPVLSLVEALLKAGAYAKAPFEIIIAEDGSTDHLDANKALLGRSKIEYHVFTENLGRAAIRNRLAELAQYTQLIFLDCDVAIPNERFVKNYSTHLAQDVVCGGHIYGKKPAAEFSLHYCYGVKRECLSLEKRNGQPYRGFKTSNFMIKKSVFDKIRFDESLTTYGHEDTLFGYALSQHRAGLLHIDNPVVHLALERNEDFLSKTKSALSNGLSLVNQGKLPASEIRALEMYHKLKDNAGGRALMAWLLRFESTFTEKVLQKNPQLSSFDFLKLVWLRQIDKG